MRTRVLLLGAAIIVSCGGSTETAPRPPSPAIAPRHCASPSTLATPNIEGWGTLVATERDVFFTSKWISMADDLPHETWTLWRVPASGGDPRWLSDLEKDARSFLPAGDYVYYATKEGVRRVALSAGGSKLFVAGFTILLIEGDVAFGVHHPNQPAALSLSTRERLWIREGDGSIADGFFFDGMFYVRGDKMRRFDREGREYEVPAAVAPTYETAFTTKDAVILMFADRSIRSIDASGATRSLMPYAAFSLQAAAPDGVYGIEDGWPEARRIQRIDLRPGHEGETEALTPKGYPSTVAVGGDCLYYADGNVLRSVTR